MGTIGFATTAKKEEEQDDNVVKTDQIEHFEHKIKLLGVPLWTSTKHHTVDIKTVEK